MILNVTVAKAKNVPNIKTFSSESNATTFITFRDETKETAPIADANPEWNECMYFESDGALDQSDKLWIAIKDRDNLLPDRLIGEATFSLKDLTKPNKRKMGVTLPLMDQNQQPTGCEISLNLDYSPPESGQAKQGRGSTLRQSMNLKGGKSIFKMEKHEEHKGDDPLNASPNVVRKPPPSQLAPTTSKPVDFQIRIKILEARQLEGSNIYPVAKITFRQQVRQTRVADSTNSPFWNELFFFNAYMNAASLMEELIFFGVYNSRTFRADSLIGSFKFDVATIYQEEGHCFKNKWLLLCCPENPQAGPKGYLKISAVVLGPGDSAPTFEDAGDDEVDDIETNLLRPAGVQLRPAMFILKVFVAEDLAVKEPDSAFSGIKKVFFGEKERVLGDPYMTFDFAGRIVKTKKLYKTMNPQWNEELRIFLQWPSMCNTVRFVVWNGVSEEAVGAAVINLATIAAIGEPDDKTGFKGGFLPTYGPAYINLYGSPREGDESHEKLDALNEGRGEGMAYRGRILIELDTTVLQDATEMEEGVFPMSSDSIPKIKKFLPRKKYRLNTIFLSASMIRFKDVQIQFEVSIGNYGNMFEDSHNKCTSITQPTNSVFDGNGYYFLPWGNSKPTVSYDCQWEDISSRLYTINYLMNFADKLEDHIEKIKVANKANLSVSDQLSFVHEALNEAVAMAHNFKKVREYCAKNDVPENELDLNLRRLREAAMAAIETKAKNIKSNTSESNFSIDQITEDLYLLLDRVREEAAEPQNSIPDIIISMLVGGKRQAYSRVKPYDVFFSKQAQLTGRFCNTAMTLNLKHTVILDRDSDEFYQIPGQVRVKMWFGLEKDEGSYLKTLDSCELVCYAETYENQVNILGKWCSEGPLMTRPSFSDAMGTVNMPKSSISAPEGWSFDGDWFINPEYSLKFSNDFSTERYVEEVFVNQERGAAGESFKPAKNEFTNVKGQPCPSPGDTKLPKGWDWDGEWQIDKNNVCDADGWAYTADAHSGGYVAVEKNYHMHRRRRLVRTRINKKDSTKAEETSTEGWEFAVMFNQQFHLEERKMDMVRRRRWHRVMVPKKPGLKPEVIVQSDKGNIKAPARLYANYKKMSQYEFRAYIYQARDLLSVTESEGSVPYAQVIFDNFSQATKRIENTVSPTWDQTLIFYKLEIPDLPDDVSFSPPQVTVEIFGFDSIGDDEYLGRTQITPMVKIKKNDDRLPVLHWQNIYKNTGHAGDILCAFELILVDEISPPPPPPRKADNLYIVPSGIAPAIGRRAVEILAWGLRRMETYKMSAITSPSVTFDIGGNVKESSVIANMAQNPNFPDPFLFMDIMLPVEELYMPPINIQVADSRSFGNKPVVGIHVIRDVEYYCVEPMYEPPDPMSNIPGFESVVNKNVKTVKKKEPKKKGFLKGLKFFSRPKNMDEDEAKDTNVSNVAGELAMKTDKGDAPSLKVDVSNIDEDIDWYSKYFSSIGATDRVGRYLELGYDTIEVYQQELEKSENFDDFNDFCSVFELYRGRTYEMNSKQVVGEFRGSFKIYHLSENKSDPMPLLYIDPKSKPSSNACDVLVRVYIIKCVDLQPNNPSGLSDSYVEVTLGEQQVSNRDNYVPNSLCPNFGQLFEIRCRLPLEKDVIVRVREYDLLGSNDVIGETKIDLESRYLTKYRATCGLPMSYSTSGPNQWRDTLKPSQILNEFCNQYKLGEPNYGPDDTIVELVNKQMSLTKEEINRSNPHLGPLKEQVALKALRSLPLVKEHLEVRPLHSPLQPGIEQGKIHMWLDIHPTELGTPGPPVDVSPRKPKNYVLRVIIRNTFDVWLTTESWTKEKMCDIYVKGWVCGIDEKQSTDVHYRSLDGEGNFNWRFLFPFSYLSGENVMVVSKRENFFSLDATERKMPCVMMLQIWDNDFFSSGDFLGAIEIDIAKLILPAKSVKACTIDKFDLTKKKSNKVVNLFETRRAYGYWPCINRDGDKAEISGKIEMELELLTEEEAKIRPAGHGRDEPNENPHLEPPKRPDTSFLWFTSPWKSFKYIIWKNFKWYFIGCLFLVFVVTMVLVFLYGLPSEMAKKTLGSVKS